jgi:hypothetical protein
MSRARRSVRRALILTASLMLSASGVAMADTPVGHSGTYGPHSLTDSDESAGARCIFDSEMYLTRVRVLPPTLFARDRTSSRDSQYVDWRVELRYRDGEGGSWGTFKNSTYTKVKAYDDTPAALARKSVSIGSQVGGGEFEVIVRMRWYRPGHPDVWEGTARHHVDRYDSTEISTQSSCVSAIY